jgi:hypothetical protein
MTTSMCSPMALSSAASSTPLRRPWVAVVDAGYGSHEDRIADTWI